MTDETTTNRDDDRQHRAVTTTLEQIVLTAPPGETRVATPSDDDCVDEPDTAMRLRADAAGVLRQPDHCPLPRSEYKLVDRGRGIATDGSGEVTDATSQNLDRPCWLQDALVDLVAQAEDAEYDAVADAYHHAHDIVAECCEQDVYDERGEKVAFVGVDEDDAIRAVRMQVTDGVEWTDVGGTGCSGSARYELVRLQDGDGE